MRFLATCPFLTRLTLHLSPELAPVSPHPSAGRRRLPCGASPQRGGSWRAQLVRELGLSSLCSLSVRIDEAGGAQSELSALTALAHLLEGSAPVLPLHTRPRTLDTHT